MDDNEINEINEIQIKFIPNFQDKEIDFNLDMLYNENTTNGKIVELNKSGLNKLPYFTYLIEYNNLSNLLTTYQERVDFFFNKENFKKTILKNGKIIKKSDDDNEKEINVAENNIMKMFELLFPTKFTVIKNYHTSYDYVFDNPSLKRMLITPFEEKKFSYLKLSNGKIYTFTRLVWVNDLLNHPIYKEIFKKFNKENPFNYPKIKNRKSINEILQNKKNENNIKKTIEQINDLYILKKNVKNIDEENIKKLMNTSIEILKVKGKKQYQIYVVADFIVGKVDDLNVNNIYCPYIGDYLGNMYEFLFESQMYGYSYDKYNHRWDINKNRFVFNIEQGKTEEKSKNKLEKDDNDNDKNESKIDVENINTIFYQKIIEPNESIKSIINELKNIVKEVNEVNEDELLIKFGKKYDILYNKDLYNIIIDTFNNDNNDQYEDNKNKILRSIEKELRTETEKKAKFEKKENRNDLETRDFSKTKLYIEILEKLKEQHEKNLSGGTKKKYISKINNKKNQTRKKRY
jgi:hypothetical protein